MKCPVCGDKQNELVITSKGSSYLNLFGVGVFECKICTFIFSDFIANEVLSLFYENMIRSSEPISISKLRDLTRANGQSQLTTIKPFLPEKLGRVLDFGGGFGEAARLYLPFSEKVYIVEKDPIAINCIKETPEIEILEEEDLLAEEYVGFFDLIIFSNVLEHVTSPKEQIQKFSRITANGGFLFVEVPYEAELRKLDSRLSGQMHVGFYTLESFRTLIKGQGSFDILDIRRCGASIDKIIKAKNLLHDIESQNTEDGYEIRALLKNTRPNQTVLENEFDSEESDGILENLSDYLFRKASSRGS